MNDNFNESIKGAFDQVEDDFNPELIWEGVQDKMDQAEKDKRRFPVWWFAGVGLVILMVSSIIYLTTTHPGIYAENKTNIVSKEPQIKTNFEPYISQPNVSKGKTEISADNEFSTSQMKQESALIIVPKVLIARNREAKIVEEKVESELFKKVNRYPFGIQGVKYYNEEKYSSKIENQSTTIIESGPESDIQTNSKLKQITMLQYLEIGDVRPIQSILDISIPSPSIDLLYVLANRDESKELFGRVEIYSGISKGSKVSISSDSDYAKVRNSSEKLLEQLSLGTRIQMLMINDFSFFAGAKYAVITDTWKVDLQYSENLPFTYIDNITEYPNGNMEENFVTVMVEHELKRKVIQYNSEKILSVPLEVKYGKQFNNWKFSVGLGLEFNYLLGTEHTIMGKDNLPAKDVKRSQWLSPSIATGLFTSYSISPIWDMNLGVSYRQLTIQNSSLIADFRSRYSLVGLELGVSMKLNK